MSTGRGDSVMKEWAFAAGWLASLTDILQAPLLHNSVYIQVPIRIDVRPAKVPARLHQPDCAISIRSLPSRRDALHSFVGAVARSSNHELEQMLALAMHR